jgi:hypothetical protein
LVLGGCRCYPGKLTDVHVSVAEGKQYCEVFELPTPWMDAKLPISSRLDGLLYRWSADSRTELLIMPMPADEIDYSTEKKFTGRKMKFKIYGVSLSIPVRVRQASEQEWGSGQATRQWPLEDITSSLLEGPSVELPPGKKDPQTFRMDGVLFARSGDIWDPYRPVLFSENRRYVALQSFNGWYQSGLTSGEGDLFLDIYRVGDRRRLGRMTGYWCDFIPQHIFRKSVWLSEKDFILPFNLNLRSFLVCHLP